MAEMHPDAVQYSIFERFLNRFLKDFERSDPYHVPLAAPQII
jgi:phosphatidylserine decarboxylase